MKRHRSGSSNPIPASYVAKRQDTAKRREKQNRRRGLALSATAAIALIFGSMTSAAASTASSSDHNDVQSGTSQAQSGSEADASQILQDATESGDTSTVDPNADVAPATPPTDATMSQEAVQTPLVGSESGAGAGDFGALADFNSTDITVTARTIAQPLGNSGSIGNNNDYTEGATFRLATFTTLAAGPGNLLDNPWATCTVPVNSGTCTITVPDTDTRGTNYNKQFWVVQTKAAEGAHFAEELLLGDYTNQGPKNKRYILGATPAMTAHSSFAMPQTTTSNATWPSTGNYSTSNVAQSFGAAAQILDNPEMTPKCTEGLNVAIQVDLSGSIGTNIGPLKTSLKELTTALTSGGSKVALFTFNTSSPAINNYNYPTPTGNQATLDSRIDALTTVSNGYTNWDKALRIVSDNASNKYDVLLFVTDGAPNYIVGANGGTSTAAPSGSSVTLRSMEAAIYSANAVKAQGIPIIAVGVGTGVTSGTENLQAISAPGDVFQESWDNLTETLRNLASSLQCEVPVTVQKYVTDSEGKDPELSDGWTINSSAVPTVEPTDVTITREPLSGSLVTGEQDETGQVDWKYKFSNPAKGTLSVSEDQQPGFEFVEGSCTVAHDDTTIDSTDVPWVDGAADIVPITIGDSVDCKVYNKRVPDAAPSAPVVEKQGLSATQVEGNPLQFLLKYQITVKNPGQSSLDYTLTDTPPTMPTGFRLTDDGWNVETVGNPAGTISTDMWKPGDGTPWTVATGTLEPDGVHTYEISAVVDLSEAFDGSAPETGTCPDTDKEGVVFWNEAEAESGGLTDEDAGCVAIPLPSLSVDKTWQSSVQSTTPHEWTVTYDVTVKNTSDVDTQYDLTDTIGFDQKFIKILGGSWTGPDGAKGDITAGQSEVNLASHVTIPAHGEHVYTIVVQAEVLDGAWTDPSQPAECAAGGGEGTGGFLNSVDLTWPGGEDTDQDCASVEQPELMKQFLSATPHEDDPNVWTVNYAVYVAGTPGSSFVVDVLDQPGYPDGVDLISGSWSTPYPEDSEGTPASGTIATAGDDAWVIQRGVTVPMSGMVRYKVSWDVRMTSGYDPATGVCDPDAGAGHGFFNQAQLVNSGTTQEDKACADVGAMVNPTIEKDLQSVVQNPDGTWTIKYDVTVTLPTDEATNPKGLNATYDLKDTLDFGDGLVPTEASWQQIVPQEAAASGNFSSTDWSASMATDKVIAVTEPVHKYEVTVKATAASSAFENGTASCPGPGAETTGGFLNRAVLSTIAGEEEDTACGEPAAPQGTKAPFGAPVQNADGTWAVRYLLTVTNPTESTSLVYKVTDSPALPTGVALADGTSWTAKEYGETPSNQVATASWDGSEGSGPWVVASGVIPGGQTYQFLVSATVAVDANQVHDTENACDTEGAGIPLQNELGIVSGEFTGSDEGCVVIPPAPSWTLEKSSNPPSGTQVNPGDSVRYTLTVTNTSEEASLVGAVVQDDLSDVLKHATLDEKNLPDGMTLDGSNLTWNVPSVEPGGKASVSYTVVVNQDAFDVTFKNVATPGSVTGICAPDACVTDHVTPQKPVKPGDPVKPQKPTGELSKTGASVGGASALALVLLGAGYLMVRRQRTRAAGRDMK